MKRKGYFNALVRARQDQLSQERLNQQLRRRYAEMVREQEVKNLNKS